MLEISHKKVGVGGILKTHFVNIKMGTPGLSNLNYALELAANNCL